MAQSKEVLRKKIELLRDERLKRSHKDQINVLDSRLGKNVGAVKERTRLLEKIKEEKSIKKGKKNGEVRENVEEQE